MFDACASETFEMPKSRILIVRQPGDRSVRNRFDGLMSRCTMPRACASARPSQAWMAYSVTLTRMKLSRFCTPSNNKQLRDHSKVP